MASRKERSRRMAAGARANSGPPEDAAEAEERLARQEALAELLAEPWTNYGPPPVGGCTGVFHDEVDCRTAGLLRQEWCNWCWTNA